MKNSGGMRLILQAGRQAVASQLHHGSTSLPYPAVHPLCRSFGSNLRSGVVAMGHGSHTSDNDPDVLMHEKKRNLTGKTQEVVPGTPGWNPQLASESEAVVKAERMGDSMDVEAMQQHTVEVVQQMHNTPLEEVEPHPQGHDPSGSHAVRSNLEYAQEEHDKGQSHKPV